MKAAQLKQLYSNYTTPEEVSVHAYDSYYWFDTDEGTVGLKREEVPEREHTLLLELFPKADREISLREDQWRRLLFQREEATFQTPPHRYRFIFFTAPHSVDQESLHEAFQALFPFPVSIIWTDGRGGVIIEEQTERPVETIAFDEVMDVLMSDFDMKIRFYVSEFYEEFRSVHTHFAFSQTMAETASRYLPGALATPLNTALYLYMDSLKEENREILASNFLKGTESDGELLDTVKVFLEHGANASAAAKTLYMHRNSLQYRIDKFTELTGMDIRQFDAGVLVYLSILHIRY